MSTPAPHSRADIRIGGGRSTYLGFAAGAGFVILGVALILAPHANVVEKIVGVLTIAMFGPLSIYATLRLLRAGCIYVLATDGIQCPLAGWPLIPWSDVGGARIVSRLGRRYLTVDVQDTAVRLRQMKSGSRAARRNLRAGLGLITIPEMYAPAGLEELQAEIERRRASDATPSAAAPGNAGVSILPTSGASLAIPAREVAPGSARRLRNISAIHALLLVLAVLAHRAAQTPHVVAIGIAAALLLGALAAQFEAMIVGLVTILAAETVLVVVDLTVGHHIALATRVLYLFFPLCVLLTVAQVWPRRDLGRG